MQRLAERLAGRVPHGDVERGQRAVEQPAGADPVTAARESVPRRLRFQDAHPDEVRAQLAGGVADRRHEIGAWVDDVADAFDAVGGHDPSQDVPVRIHRSPPRDVRALDGNPQYVHRDLRDLCHGLPMLRFAHSQATDQTI